MAWPTSHGPSSPIPPALLQDGLDVKPSERIAALQVVGQLEQQLRQELVSEGIDPDQAALVEDDSCWEEGQEVPETGHLDENGEMRRPWCAATRMLDHREQVRGGGEGGGPRQWRSRLVKKGERPFSAVPYSDSDKSCQAGRQCQCPARPRPSVAQAWLPPGQGDAYPVDGGQSRGGFTGRSMPWSG